MTAVSGQRSAVDSRPASFDGSTEFAKVSPRSAQEARCRVATREIWRGLQSGARARSSVVRAAGS